MKTFEDILTGPHLVEVHPGTAPRGTWYIKYGSRFFNQNFTTLSGQWVEKREQASEYLTYQAAREAANAFNIKLTN